MNFLDGVKLDVKLDLPAMVFIFIFIILFFILYRTQRSDNGFDFSQMLRDESGKPSSGRLATFVCLAASTWALMYILVTKQGTIDPWIFIAYTGIWSGAKVAEVAIQQYFNKGGSATSLSTSTVTSESTVTNVSGGGGKQKAIS